VSYGRKFLGRLGMSMETDILEIVAKQAKVDVATLKRDTRLSELDLQSIDIVELVFALEDKFDIAVPYSPSDMTSAGISFETIGDIVDAMDRLNTEQHPQKTA
jgi:acyl carrier protein